MNQELSCIDLAMYSLPSLAVRVFCTVPAHLFRLIFNGYVLPLAKMVLAMLAWPRAAMKWGFWRRVFCTLWFQLIWEAVEKETGDPHTVLSTVVDIIVKGSAKISTGVPVKTVTIERSGQPLSQTANKIRERVSQELQTLQVVSVLLASMTFSAFSVSGSGDSGGGAAGVAWARRAFVLTNGCAFIFAITTTAMFARLSTVLSWCPERTHFLWFLYRFEPTVALMHILFTWALACTVLAALCGGWHMWGGLHMEGYMIALSVVAGVCGLYFFYSYSNGFYCLRHGLRGNVMRTYEYAPAIDNSPDPFCCPTRKIDVKRKLGHLCELHEEVTIGHHAFFYLVRCELQALLEHEFMCMLSKEPFALFGCGGMAPACISKQPRLGFDYTDYVRERNKIPEAKGMPAFPILGGDMPDLQEWLDCNIKGAAADMASTMHCKCHAWDKHNWCPGVCSLDGCRAPDVKVVK